MVSVVPLRAVHDRTSLDPFNYPCPPDCSSASLASSKVSMRASSSSAYHLHARSPSPRPLSTQLSTQLSPRRSSARPKQPRENPPQNIHPGQSAINASQRSSFSTESLKKTLSSITAQCSTPPPPSVSNVSYPAGIISTAAVKNFSPKNDSFSTKKKQDKNGRRNNSPPQNTSSTVSQYHSGNSHKTKGPSTTNSSPLLTLSSSAPKQLEAGSSPAPKSRRPPNNSDWDMPDQLPALKPNDMEKLTWQQLSLTRGVSTRNDGNRTKSSKSERNSNFFDTNPFYDVHKSDDTASAVASTEHPRKPRHKRASSLRNAPSSMSTFGVVDSSFPVAGDVFYNTPKSKNDDLHLPHSAGNQGRRRAGANHAAAVGLPAVGGGIDNPKYAGPKFHNSPAPSELPQPKSFLSPPRQ